MANQQWLVKILSGIHAGAETELSHGTYVLGSHEDCDLVLVDSQLAQRQCKISVSESGVTVQSFDEQHQMTVDGESIGPDCSPEKHQIVGTAGIEFVFGLSGEAWPTLSPTTQGNTLSKENDGKVKVAGEDETTSTSATTQERVAHIPGADEKALDEEVSHEIKNKSFVRGLFGSWTKLSALKTSFLFNRWLVFGILAGTLFIMLVSSFFWLWNRSVPETTIKSVNYYQVAESVIKDMELPHIKVRSFGGGSVAIGGYIANDTVKNALKARLEEENVPARFQLTILSDMLAQARQVLNKKGYSKLSLSLDTMPGVLVLSGYAPDAKYISAVTDLLITEVPGLLSLVEQVEYSSTREKSLNALLLEQGLHSKIQLVSHDEKIILKGRLGNVSEGYRFKKAVKAFRQQYGKFPELVIDVTIPSASINTLGPKLEIKSISLGRTPYIILGNNEKYLSGARLENGYILESIGLDYLVLRLGQQRIKYHVRHHNE